MKTEQPELRAIPQFDRRTVELRLERVPLSAEEANADGIIPLISVSWLDGCHRSRYCIARGAP